jgi:hypothetical protein
MSAGVYLYNGKLSMSKNLEKSLKRRKSAIIIEECDIDQLIEVFDKHKSIIGQKSIRKPIKYHWKHKTKKQSIHSAYPILHVSNPDDWEQENPDLV